MSNCRITSTRNDAINKILVVTPRLVGDTIMTQSLLRLIKQQDPTCSIDVLSRIELHDLLKHMPEVDNCLVSPFKSGELQLFDRFKSAKEISKKLYKQVYVIPHSFKSAMVPFLANIPIRTGRFSRMCGILLNDARKTGYEKLNMVKCLASLGIPKNSELPTPFPFPKLSLTKKQLRETLEKLEITVPQKPILAICPGAATSVTKRYPTSHFAEVAKAKKKDSWEVWILGGPNEAVAAQEIQKYSFDICTDFTGKTSLSDAIALLSLAKVTVANDSGLMHIASALDGAVVAIYGATPPEFAPPLTNRGKSLFLNLDCTPCRKEKCRFENIKCLYNLRPELVIQAIDELSQ